MTTSGDGIEYTYRGVPPTPAIAIELIRELFAGRIAETKAISEEVLRVHLSRGGAAPQQANFADSVIKTALTSLKKGDKRKTLGSDTGEFGRKMPRSALEPAPSEAIAMTLDPEIEPSTIEPENLPAQSVPERVIGKGRAAVYVYYLPTYRIRAEEQNEKSWPCKIGRTDRDPLQRIVAQAGTALPERPIIALVINTSYPISLEAALHGVLTLRGLKIDDLPGNEWFLTSPDEILSLVRVFDPSLAEP